MTKNSKPMRVAIYIRVSTRIQEERYSLKAQKTELNAYAKKQGWTVVDLFQDVDSGAKLAKPGLEALMDCVEEGLVDLVLVLELDRLSRLNSADWEFLKEVLRENRVKIAEPGTTLDLSNEDDEFMSDLRAIFARHNRRKIKRTMNRGLRQLAREGKLYGRIPDEYEYDGAYKVRIDESRAWIIPYIDRLYVEEGYGLNRIAYALNKRCKTKSGSIWTANQVKTRLLNKAYHGVLEREFMNGEHVSTDDAYPALRTKETYDRIQMRMKNAPEFRIPAPNYNHALRQLKIRCTTCGRVLSVIKGATRDSGHTNFYVGHTRRYRTPCPAAPYYNADVIIRPLFDLVKSILLKRSSLDEYTANYKENTDTLSGFEKELSAVEAKIKGNNEKLDRILDLYLEGDWSKKKLDDTKEKIEHDNLELSDQARILSKKIDLIKQEKYSIQSYLDVLGNIEEYAAIFMRMVELDELLPVELSQKDQERLIMKMFDSLEIDGEKGQAVIYGKSVQGVPIPFHFRLDDINLVAEQKLRTKQFERYLSTQRILDEQREPISFMELKRLTGLNVQTLNEDARLFGEYKNLKLKKGSSEKKQQAIKVIKQCLKKDIDMPSIEIAEKAGINPGTVLKYIREYNLRPSRKNL